MTLQAELPASDIAMAMPAVSVVIINKDERFLEHTLEVLRPQIESFPGGAEVVVIDASAGRLDDIRVAAPWVRWFDYVAPVGVTVSIPHQRNRGVTEARGAVIAFCDSGGEPSGHWLSELVTPILDGHQFASCGPVESVRASVYRTANDIPDGEIPSSPPTANMAFSRVSFDAVGGFDESFRYGSDVDFAWQLQDADMPVRQVRAAVMGMDWGDGKRQTRRSKLYGAAQAQLWLKHRRRWAALPRTAPALLVYPAWLAAFVPAAVRALRGKPRTLLAWAAVPVALVAKNRRAPQPTEVVRQNMLFGFGALAQIARRFVRRRPLVLMMPREEGVYQGTLRDELAGAGLDVGYFPEPTRSETINLVLLPWSTLWARVGGTRIVHIHWTYKLRPPWAHGSETMRRGFRLWFQLWLRWCSVLGVEIVWTAHNLLPHNRVFDDDDRARRALVGASSVIISLNTHGATQLVERWNAESITIGPAVATVDRRDRSAARTRRGDPDGACIVGWFGQVERYKGVDRLVAAAQYVPDVAFHVAGRCRDTEVASALHDAADAAANVEWADRRVSDDELADLCAAAELAVFPFRDVANSASVQTALAAGRPVAIPDLPGLADVPAGACLRFAVDAEPEVIAATIRQFFDLSTEARERMESAAADTASRTSWRTVAEAHLDVYRSVLS